MTLGNSEGLLVGADVTSSEGVPREGQVTWEFRRHQGGVVAPALREEEAAGIYDLARSVSSGWGSVVASCW